MQWSPILTTYFSPYSVKKKLKIKNKISKRIWVYIFFWLTLIRACLSWLFFPEYESKGNWVDPTARWIRSSGGKPGLWSVQPMWEISSSVPPVVLAKSACAERISVGERERERESCGRKEKKRRIRRRSRFVLFFLFSFCWLPKLPPEDIVWI